MAFGRDRVARQNQTSSHRSHIGSLKRRAAPVIAGETIAISPAFPSWNSRAGTGSFERAGGSSWNSIASALMRSQPNSTIVGHRLRIHCKIHAGQLTGIRVLTMIHLTC